MPATNKKTMRLLLLFVFLLPVSLLTQPLNILWITCEDMSPRIGPYGDYTVPTPNLDRLAKESIRYTQAFGTYGVCAPNRHTLIMGMYPTSTGAMAMRTHKRTSAIADISDPELLNIPVYEATPPPQAKCFTEYLRAAGYYCTNNRKTDYQFMPPITAWDESNSEAHWRHRPNPDMPFFAVFNNTLTHESGTFKPRSPRVVDPEKIQIPPYYPQTPTVREDLARHYDNIHAMDRWVGEILDQLEADGLMDKTLIFFFSDHGDGLPRAKRWVYDSGLHVPLLIRFPDGKGAHTMTDQLVSFVDFAPTVLHMAGVEIPDHMEGHAFLGDKVQQRKYIYACRDRMDPAIDRIRAVRDHRFKYIRNYRPDLPYVSFLPYRDRAAMMREILRLRDSGLLGPAQWQFWAQQKPLEELYDTWTDPHEIHNLAADPQYFAKLHELREAHQNWRETYGDLGDMPETELIKHLWPPQGVQPVTADPELVRKGNQLQISCASQGASIAYRIDGGERWLLYTEPVAVPKGSTVEAQAIRLGWQKSGIVKEEW
jgi:N-sulfoglucosamine sulfohydrolase